MLSSVGSNNLSFSSTRYIKWGQDAQLISKKLEPEKLLQHTTPSPRSELVEVVQSSKLLQDLGNATDVYVNNPSVIPNGAGLEGTLSIAFRFPGKNYQEKADRVNIKAKSFNMEGLYGNFKKVLAQLPESISELGDKIEGIPRFGIQTRKTSAGSWSIVKGN